jgi:formylmethanofuran dehydrogenase subunit E
MQKLDFGSEGSKRNFGRRGGRKSVCDECGEECLIYQAYTKGKAVLCKKCREKKEKELFE